MAGEGAPLPLQPLSTPHRRRACYQSRPCEGAAQRLLVRGADRYRHRVRRRGRRYGTNACDPERGRVLNLLPGRVCELVRDWLVAHPDAAVLNRDRAGPYTEAARLGEPQAIQVADRWYLLVNASGALRTRVGWHQAEIREAARKAPSHDFPATVAKAPLADPPPTQDSGQGGGRRRHRCKVALRLRGEGTAILTNARMLGASRNSVRRWLRAGVFVPYRWAPAPSRLDAYLRFVEVRWQDDQHNEAGLWREFRAIDFEGGYDIVQRWAKRRRHRLPARRPKAGAGAEQVRDFGAILRAGIRLC